MKTLVTIRLSLLLAAGCSLAPMSLHAQSGNPGPQTGLLSQDESTPATPGDSTRAKESASAAESHWVVRVGALGAFYHSGSTIATRGRVIPGTTAIVSNNLTVMFDIRRYITKNLSLSLMAGVPPKPIITGKGAVVSLGQLGKVRYGPAILTANYHFPNRGPFRPYAGVGAAYAIILKEHDATVSELKVHNNWGIRFAGRNRV